MSSRIAIRAERPCDSAIITDVVRRAYASVPYSDHREHVMIARLRESDAFLPTLSLLAETDGEAVGHVLLTRATIGKGRRATETLALAPLSVVPERRSEGIGTALVRSAHKRATALGIGSVVVVGIPGYYGRFGYKRLSAYPIALPFRAPDELCMILPLRPGALDDVAGRIHFAAGWLDH